MYLGIEIGGTKLQLGVGDGDRPEFAALERRSIDAGRGAEGILQQIRSVAGELVQRFDVERVGFGFGGPVDGAAGRVITSHQVAGWTGFALADWCQESLGRPAVLGNDCDCAALAEARYGAGQGQRTVFYVTVGTGVGGGLVIDGRVHGTDRPAAAEIGHLRPGLFAADPHDTVESLVSGWGIAATARACLSKEPDRPVDCLLPGGRPTLSEADATDLRKRCDGKLDSLTAVQIGEAAAAGNRGAREIFQTATETLGWAVAQVVSLLAPDAIVVGGGVSLLGEDLFFIPLREAVARYVFPPLANSVHVTGPKLGEEVVVHGAIALGAHGR